jgi:HTH-type transcriptional regulator/antitoxin HipB
MKDRFLTTPQAVGEAVRAGRKEAGWSQAELAVRAGVGRRFVVDVESGHPRAELAKVLALLDAVGVHATALPAVPVPIRPQDMNLKEVIARFA